MNTPQGNYAGARLQSGMSLDAAASALGMDTAELASYEAGSELPDAVVILHMALLYGVSADLLIGNDQG